VTIRYDAPLTRAQATEVLVRVQTAFYAVDEAIEHAAPNSCELHTLRVARGLLRKVEASAQRRIDLRTTMRGD